MRKVDEHRAENYIKNHVRYKKWLVFALCISLLTGTLTLYGLNKPATAMTQEGAKDVGLVLETADDEFEAGLIEQMENDDPDDGDDQSDDAEEAASDENSSTEDAEQDTPEGDAEQDTPEGDAEQDTPAEDAEQDTPAEDAEQDTPDEDAEEGDDVEDPGSDSANPESEDESDKSSENDSDASGEASSDDVNEDDNTEEVPEEEEETSDEAGKAGSLDIDDEEPSDNVPEDEKDEEEDEEDASDSASSKNSIEDDADEDASVIDSSEDEEEDEADAASSLKSKEDEEDEEDDAEKKDKEDDSKKKDEEDEDELDEDVVLTVSYVDEEGESLKDDKEISISDSISFEDEAPQIEGYTFEKATIDGDSISSVSVKKSDDGYKYYEVTFMDGDSEDIKEDKTVVLTYKAEDAEEDADTELTEDVTITVSYVDEEGESLKDEKELSISDSIDFTKEAPEIEGYEFKEASIGDKIIRAISVKKTDDEAQARYYEVTLEDESSEDIKEDANLVLTYKALEEEEEETKSVVLTASFVDEEGNELREEEELKIKDSFEFAEEAPEIEGYEFRQAVIEDKVITSISVKENAEETEDEEDKEDKEEVKPVYEVTFDDDSVKELTEDTTVVLTYAEIEVKTSVVLTAKYVDKDGEDIAESKELKISGEKTAKDLEPDEIDGYFYEGLFYEENEIVNIEPVFDEEAAKESDAEDEKAEDDKEDKETADEEAQDKIIAGYKLTTADDETVEITEDSEIAFTFVRASKETEFTFSDKKVKIKVTTNKKNVFPEGVELKAAEVTAESEKYNYDAYMDALNDSAETIAEQSGKESTDELTDNNTLLYDIAFIYNDKEIQPKDGSVTVSIEFRDQQLSDGISASDDENVAVVHLPIREEVKEESEIVSTEDATDITKEDIEVETLTDASATVADKEEKVEFTSESFSVFAVISYQSHEPGTDTYKSVLGDAINFGITAGRIKFSESETNFAVKIVDADGQTGNDMTNPEEQTFMAGEVNGNFKIKGEPAYFIVPKDYAGRISHNGIVVFGLAEKNAIVDSIEKMLQYVRDASADLAKRADNAQIVYDSNSQKSTIDLRSYADNGTYYVTIDDSNKYKVDQADKLKILKKPGQTIVFNVRSKGDFVVHKYKVGPDENSTVGSDTLAGTKEDTVARTIIWNFIDAGTVSVDAGAAGVMISGNKTAKWYNSNPTSGWLVFPDVELVAEFHNTYNDIRKIGGTAQFEALKTIDGDPATVSGFKFTLYKQDSNNGWTELQSVRTGYDKDNNIKIIDQEQIDASHISFESIAYGADNAYGRRNFQYTTASPGNPETFIYKIAETAGTAGDDGSSYTPDTRVYYAKVTVTYREVNEFTKTAYYDVSKPVYYDDNNGRIGNKISGVPTFNNVTKTGHAAFTLYKYLNGGDPGKLKFDFTVRVLQNDGSLKVLTDKLQNDGSVISYDFDYNNSLIAKDGKIYLIVTENDITQGSTTQIKKDPSYIYVRIDDPGTDNQKIKYYYVKVPEGGLNDANTNINIKRLYDDGYPDKHIYVNAIAKGSDFYIPEDQLVRRAAFQNTGDGMLRIHKMVVNEFGESLVRDGTDSILKNVWFRITKKGTGDYIVFKGFVGSAGTEGQARGYGAFAGKTYRVVYNESAQWSIFGLPAGKYSVEEVGDGFTFTYDESSNTSSLIPNAPGTRVTMYGVTTDPGGGHSYGDGGDNKRAVFSVDVPGKIYGIPTDVVVGEEVQTVQVANYYSLPVGPIQVAKNLTGGPWGDAMSFKFKIEAIGYEALDSERLHYIDAGPQPMPERTEAVVTKADENDGKAIADFGSISFRYEGEYRYKITEDETDRIDGISYNVNHNEYYVKVIVTKKDTTFKKTYTYSKLRNPARSEGDTTNVTEEFHYLGANIIYYSDPEFAHEVTRCELFLGENPDTGITSFSRNNFIPKFTEGTSVNDIVFTNTRLGSLKVRKVWDDIDGGDESSKHQSLTLSLWQRVKGTTQWSVYETSEQILLTPGNHWSQEITGLPLKDSQGNEYEYCVKEGDEWIDTHNVTYTYDGIIHDIHDQKKKAKITVGGESVYDPGYAMNFKMDQATGAESFGEVVITNTKVYTNTLPSTGGVGEIPYLATGLGIALAGFLGGAVYRKKKEDELEEKDN